MHRARSSLWTVVRGAALVVASTSVAQAQVKASMVQLRDAWLSTDAAVVGTYRGTDSTLGPRYHVIDVKEVWMGSVARGRLLFKAPRGIAAEPEHEVLLMLWDRLNSVTDGFLETSQRRYGEDVWERIGPDSLASYLLPFPKYSFQFEGGKMKLRGTNIFSEERTRAELHDELLDFEFTLLPDQLYRQVDAVARARVRKLEKKSRNVEDVPVEYRVYVEFDRLESIKGDVPERFELQYSSFPRAPRFEEDEEVVLFLSRLEDRYYLKQGKRAVYHVFEGAVNETGQPLREFIKSLAGGEG